MWLACQAPLTQEMEEFKKINLDYGTKVDGALQRALEGIDAAAQGRLGMSTEQTAVGVLDLRRGRVAMIHPDREEYGASVPKIGILLAYFALRPNAVGLSNAERNELGLMVKASSNEAAAKFSQMLGLKEIQRV